jgi:hypothetical protein
MPLVKALTAKSIGQVWFDHTGHNDSRIYGSKTKEWSFDTVVLLEQVANSNADVAMRLKFEKTRRRTPSNRADFQNVTITLSGDEWSGDASDGTARNHAGGKRLTAKQQGWLKDIMDIFAAGVAELRTPLPDMQPILTLTRDQVRAGLREKGRFQLDPNGTLLPKDRTALHDALNALKDQGKLGLSDKLVWLT